MQVPTAHATILPLPLRSAQSATERLPLHQTLFRGMFLLLCRAPRVILTRQHKIRLMQFSSSSRCHPHPDAGCVPQDFPHPDVSLIGGSSLSRCHPHPDALRLPHGGQAPSHVPVAVLISIFTPLEQSGTVPTNPTNRCKEEEGGVDLGKIMHYNKPKTVKTVGRDQEPRKPERAQTSTKVKSSQVRATSSIR